MKQLYNKIIDNIAKSIKQTLNEDIQNFDVTQYNDDTLNHQDINDITKITPKTNEEFYDLVAKRVKQNPENPYLLDINTFYVTDMSDLFWYNENKDDYIISQMYSYYKKYRTRPDLIKLDLSTWNTSNVTNMSAMFRECEGLQNLDLSNFDTSNVTSMKYIFYQCRSLSKLNISSFDTSNVRSMCGMFCRCNNLKKLDLSHFNIQNVEDMRWVFYECTSLRYLNLYKWDFNKYVDIHEMFKNTKNIRDLRLSKSVVLKLIGYGNNVALKVL